VKAGREVSDNLFVALLTSDPLAELNWRAFLRLGRYRAGDTQENAE
jgi:hypothetical protein